MMLALEGTSLEKLRELEKEQDRFTQLIADNKDAGPKAPVAGASGAERAPPPLPTVTVQFQEGGRVSGLPVRSVAATWNEWAETLRPE